MMDAQASPLILTKYRLPASRSRSLSRPRLVERLNCEAGAGLILVCAPAGYGKTTLLVEWARDRQQHGTAVAWVTLEASDDDPLPFGSYLVASFVQALGPLPELVRLVQLLQNAPEVELQRLLPGLINALAADGRECVLVLDDYHLIGAPAIHSALAFLIEHLPETVHIVLGSRSDPPLPLARLRARGQLLELRSRELRFSADETAQFFQQVMRLELPPAVIASLAVRSEGWIAGLQLAGLFLADRPDPESFLAGFYGSHRYLVEYLLEEVFNQQPEAVRSFLLSTAILERLCAPLCDALCGGPPHSRAILEHLDKANLFLVALDDQGEWYRYHQLFGDFLRAALHKAGPERAAGLHRCASQWYAAKGFLREAARHALLTQDWAYAAAVVEQHSFTLMIHSEISTLAEWCAAFPEAVMAQHPLLCILQSWTLVLSMRGQYQARIAARLQQAEQAAQGLEDGQLKQTLSEHIAVVRTYQAMAPDPRADPRKQLAIAQQMLAEAPEAEASQFSARLTLGYCHLALHEAQSAGAHLEAARQIALRQRLYLGIVESTFSLARLKHSRGQLRQAAELCRQGQAELAALLAHPEQTLPAAGCLDIALGAVLLEQNHLEEAERRLLAGLDRIGGGSSPVYLLAGCVALWRLRTIQDRPAEAAACLTRLEDAWPDIAFCTRGLRVLQGLRAAPQDPAMRLEAAAWCQAFAASPEAQAPPPGLGPFGAAEAYYLARLAWMHTQIALGDAAAIQPYLEAQLAVSRAHGLGSRVIELSVLEALARQAAGEDSPAWEAALERALAAAQPEGFVRSFDQGAVLHRLLNEAARRPTTGGQHTGGGGRYTAYIEQILAATGPQVSPQRGYAGGQPSQPLALQCGQQLSERELEVLRLIAQGASNQEIAGQLVITLGTVKSHINHILVKLEVHNRTAGVARARQLGVLEI